MPAAPPKLSTVPRAPPKQSTMPGDPILSLEISFLQSSRPARITRQSGVRRSQDFLDLDCYTLPALSCISWFRSLWQGQSVIPDPSASIGRASCVLLPHGRHFSPLLRVCGCGLQVVQASIEHLHARWPCPLPFPQSHKSRAHLFWYTLFTVWTFADLCKREKLWHNPSTSPPFQGICQWLSSNSSQLMSSSLLPLSLSVLRSPLVQCLDNTKQCAPPDGICSISEYACCDASHSPNYYQCSHCRYHGTSGTSGSALNSASCSSSMS